MHRHRLVGGWPMGRDTHQYIMYTCHQYTRCECDRLSGRHSGVCVIPVLYIRPGTGTWKGKHKIGPFSTPVWKRTCYRARTRISLPVYRTAFIRIRASLFPNTTREATPNNLPGKERLLTARRCKKNSACRRNNVCGQLAVVLDFCMYPR